jgi:hypothetical protein
VLCEKPMATTIADAVRMLQACPPRGRHARHCLQLAPAPGLYPRARARRRRDAWDASCSPRRSGRSACAAATARRRAQRSRSGGTRRS